MENNTNKDDFKEKSFEMNGRTIDYHVKVVKKVEQDILNLNDKDKEFITYSLVDAEILLKQLDADKDLDNFSAQDLDILIYYWLNKRFWFKYVTDDEFVGAIGAAFGYCMNKENNSTWSIISDEYGTDYACISESPQFQTFPFSSVWKAIEQNRVGSLQDIIDLVKKNISDGIFG